MDVTEIIQEKARKQLSYILTFACWLAAFPFVLIYVGATWYLRDVRMVVVMALTTALWLTLLWSSQVMRQRYSQTILYPVFAVLLTQSLAATALLEGYLVHTLLVMIATNAALSFGITPRTIITFGVTTVVGFVAVIWLNRSDLFDQLPLSSTVLAINNTVLLVTVFGVVVLLLYVNRRVTDHQIGKMVAGNEELSQALALIRGAGENVSLAVSRIRSSTEALRRSAGFEQERAGQAESAMSRMREILQATDGAMSSMRDGADSGATATLGLIAELGRLGPRLQKLEDFAHDTETAMTQMAANASAIADNVGDVAKATERTASNSSALGSSLSQIGQDISAAADEHQELSRRAKAVRTAVQSNREGMERIEQSYQAITEAVGEFEQGARHIAQVVDVIEDISMRTRLLSLNASILAQRAGEHGSGFDVVAGEIKQLSEETRVSTQEIEGLVRAIELRRRQTQAAMSQGQGAIQNGKTLTRQAGVAIEEVLTLNEAAREKMEHLASDARSRVSQGARIATDMASLEKMGHQILAATGQQRQTAEYISQIISETVSGIHTISQALGVQARSGEDVARQIQALQELSEGVRATGREQLKAGEAVAEAIHVVQASAAEVVEQADELRDATERLEDQSQTLTKASSPT